MVGVTERPNCKDSSYYDPNTRRCHPCSECHPPRPRNVYCTAQCKGLFVMSLSILWLVWFGKFDQMFPFVKSLSIYLVSNLESFRALST